MEKQYKLTDRVSKDSLKSPTFKKWLKRGLCVVFILSLALQLTLCFLPMQASAEESVIGTWVFNDVISYSGTSTVDYAVNFTSDGVNYTTLRLTPRQYMFYNREGSNATAYANGTWLFDARYKSIYIISDPQNSEFKTWLRANAIMVVEEVYDFTGEYRLFNEQLTNLSFAQAGTVTQSYAFDFNIWGGYNADYFIVQADGSSVDISYSFTDDGSGGIKTVYRQLLRDGDIVGTWLVPRARLIYFQSNPEDPTFQQWLLDNTTLIDEAMIDSVYGFGYDNGYNDGWTNSAIGDTLKAPVEALNSIVLLDIAGTTITLGGVIFTMVVLSLMLIFLKKYAGG